MARKGVNVVICIIAVVVMVIAISQHHVVEAAPGFGACHTRCTDQCVVEGFDKPFCVLKCDNFCSDHLNEGNGGSRTDTDQNTVGEAMAIANAMAIADENH